MLIAVQILVYLGVVAGSLAFLLVTNYSLTLRPYRKGALVGLWVSPVGLIAPYLLFGLLVLLCHGTWPTNGIPVVDSIARLFVGFLPILGPCICPVAVVLGLTIFYPRNGNAEQNTSGNSGCA